jgi:hypothetical protein
MMIFRLLNFQGIAGIAVALALGVMLLIQKGETRHWRKESAGFEQLYTREQAAFATTVADVRAAADQARAADRANVARVTAAQKTINQRTADEYQTRLAAARARAQQLRLSAQAAANPGGGARAAMPALPAAAGRLAEGPGQDRLSGPDALTATEQAIQLDELIKWVRAQAAIDNNGGDASSRSH